MDRTNDTLALASKAAKEGAETTRSMAARAGRSSHVPEHYASYHGPTGAKAKYAILPIETWGADTGGSKPRLFVYDDLVPARDDRTSLRAPTRRSMDSRTAE